jgi:pyruvate formate lyase activating enzyme
MSKTVLPIYDFTPFTMLDFPDKTACIIWFSGCNMRCAYCHNPSIVKGKGKYPVEEIISFLERRRGLLDGVVLSGGEATVYRDIPILAKKIKETGNFAIKLDTNGTRPDIVKRMLKEELIDYVALDYKAPFHKCKMVTGIDKFKEFEDTLLTLCNQNKVPFEIRTTVHTDIMNELDIKDIIYDLECKGYKGIYHVQNYRHGNTLRSLPEQRRPLNIAAISKPKDFVINFRNFKAS